MPSRYDEMTWIEAVMLLCPATAGGRQSAIEPRAGSYLPFVVAAGELVRVRVIEGPPRLAPGDAARVVLESETLLDVGVDLPLVERARGEAALPVREAARVVGSVTILRVWRGAIAV